jgi:diguanylate cyclase (GGDEF)-like protein
LFTQTHFFEVLQQEHERSRRYKYTYSIIIFDVDYFKDYNDNNGHLNGSRALEKIGFLMKAVFRTGDILAKYGGDEFVILLPHTDKVGAFLAADRLRESVESERFEGQERQPEGNLTLSLGVSSYPEHGGFSLEVLAKADKALYAAKRMGRNRTVIYTEDIDKPD